MGDSPRGSLSGRRPGVEGTPRTHSGLSAHIPPAHCWHPPSPPAPGRITPHSHLHQHYHRSTRLLHSISSVLQNPLHVCSNRVTSCEHSTSSVQGCKDPCRATAVLLLHTKHSTSKGQACKSAAVPPSTATQQQRRTWQESLAARVRKVDRLCSGSGHCFKWGAPVERCAPG